MVTGGIWDSGIGAAINRRNQQLAQGPNQNDLNNFFRSLGGGGLGGGVGGGTGVRTGPFGRSINLGGTGRGEPQPPGPTGPSLLDQVRSSYGALTSELERMRQQYAQDIGQSTSSTARYLEGVDPTAAYRVTAPMLAAPTAASATYLNAIGANPSQVEAQRDFINQMLASQTASQGAYSQATDMSNQAYRQAQIAELYRNQAEAQAGLNAAAMGARTNVGLRQLEQEQAIKNALLEYQLALMQAQMGKGGGGRKDAAMPFPDIGRINF